MIDSLVISRSLGVKHSHISRIIKTIVSENPDFSLNGMVKTRKMEYRGVEFDSFLIDDLPFVILIGKMKTKKNIGIEGCEISETLNEIDPIVFKDAMMIQFSLKPKDSGSKNQSELRIHRFVVENFSSIFGGYKYIGSEVEVDGGDKIDILAKDEKGRDALIEIKVGGVSAHKQLRSYSFSFDNPLLINLTYFPVPDKKRVSGITYIDLELISETLGFEKGE